MREQHYSKHYYNYGDYLITTDLIFGNNVLHVHVCVLARKQHLSVSVALHASVGIQIIVMGLIGQTTCVLLCAYDSYQVGNNPASNWISTSFVNKISHRTHHD